MSNPQVKTTSNSSGEDTGLRAQEAEAQENKAQGSEAANSEVDRSSQSRGGHHIGLDPMASKIWEHVSHSPVKSLWSFGGASPKLVIKRTGKAFLDDNLVSRAAELGYYFLFALFPMLLCASSILGLAAQRAHAFYIALLNYLSIVIPHSAFNMVIDTFNQTTAASSGGKITFGLVAALWSASVGFGAIQDTANIVYKVKESRPYWKAKLQAIGVTLLLTLVISVALAVLLSSDYLVRRVELFNIRRSFTVTEVMLVRIGAWIVVAALLMLLFAIIYYFAPNVKNKRWHWLTPGATIAIFGWIVASLSLRVYLHYFNTYSATYGSLGAVIILLTWFYITGLTLLLGAEINSEIQAVVAENRLKNAGQIPENVSAEPDEPNRTEPAQG